MTEQLYSNCSFPTNGKPHEIPYDIFNRWHLAKKAEGIKQTSDKYSYDSYYRLKEVKYDFSNNTAARTDNFYQDSVHNIEQSTENGVTYAWGVDKLNRLRNKEVGRLDPAFSYFLFPIFAYMFLFWE